MEEYELKNKNYIYQCGNNSENLLNDGIDLLSHWLTHKILAPNNTGITKNVL